MIPPDFYGNLQHRLFLLFSFSVFTIFSCRFRAVDKPTHVDFRAHVKIASRRRIG